VASKLKRTLNDVDRYFIAGNKEMTDKELSMKLRVVIKSIRDYRDTLSAEKHVAPTKQEKKKDYFARKGGAVVMTEAQSERIDINDHRPAYMDNCTVHTRPE